MVAAVAVDHTLLNLGLRRLHGATTLLSAKLLLIGNEALYIISALPAAAVWLAGSKALIYASERCNLHSDYPCASAAANPSQ